MIGKIPEDRAAIETIIKWVIRNGRVTMINVTGFFSTVKNPVTIIISADFQKMTRNSSIKQTICQKHTVYKM